MLLGFKKRFVRPIQVGSKIHTVRNFRKVKPKIGETLYMYTGLRTRNCELISNKETLKSEQGCRIFYMAVWNPDWTFAEKQLKIYVDNRELSSDEMDEFFVNDGFENKQDFLSWWLRDGHEEIGFIGALYNWTDFKY